MDLLYGSDQKLSDMDDEMNCFLDNDMFQPTMTPGTYEDDEWFNSFFEDPVLNDKMITDAAQPPRINSEHSYSSNVSNASSPISDDGKLEDFDCEFLINNNALDLSKKTPMTSVVKMEPVIKTEAADLDPIQTTSTATPTILTRTFTVTKQQPTIILASPNGQTALSERSVLPKITVKQEPPDTYDGLDPSVNIDSLVLPPTPPSSNNSDSDSCPSPQRSAPNSPVRQHPYSRQHHSPSSLSSCSLSPTGSSKYYNQPISSNQSENMDIVFQQIPQSGVLILSEEEKRTLISEGYPIPTKLPLTKQEEKNLKKIRRKIKNKISAQESRRKKKEYLEALEKRVESFSHENNELKRKVDTLESNNRSLLGQLQKLQSLVGKIPRPSGTVPQTGTALMVLVFCFAVFLGGWAPTSLNIGYSTSKPGYSAPVLYPQLSKPAPMMGPPVEGAKVDAYCTPNMKSRVLMSLRGEQDELNWYEFIGPNVPHNTYEKKPAEVAVTEDETNYGPVPNEVVSGTNDSKKTASDEIKGTVEIVKVTVDGRFGQVKNASSGENLKATLPSDMDQMIRVEGRIDSAADAIEV